MGNEQMKKNERLCKQVDSPHPMLNLTYVQTVQSQQFLKAEWPFYSQQQFKSWEKKYKSLTSQFQGQEKAENTKKYQLYQFFLPIHYSYTKVGICSPSGIVTMYYPMVSHSLVQDLQQKAKTNEPFTEQQLWVLIYKLTQSVSYAHSKRIAVGDIRSENILVDFSKKKVLMATEASWIGEKEFKQKVKCGDEVFISAQMNQMDLESQSLLQVEINNDDFSLGMTLAECLLLQDLSKIYQKVKNSRRKRQINIQRFEKIIQNLLKLKYYSLKLLLIVAGLIQLQQKQRLSCCQVYQIIKPHSKSIFNHKEFNLTKQALVQRCPQKYSALQNMLKQFRSKTNRQMFQNKQLVSSRAMTINGISTVHNVKRTFDQTFNLSFLDASKGQIQKHLKLSAAYNQSENYSRQIQHFSNRNRNSEVQQLQNQAKKSPQQKKFSKPIINLSNQRPQTEMAISQVKEMSSQVKQWKLPSLLPVTNAVCQDQQLINTERLANPPFAESFSFHSPESKVKIQDKQIQTPKRKTLLQARSVSESTQTLLIVPSIYSVSNPPESYISYHYSKSLSKRGQPKGNNKSQLQMSLNFQDYIPTKPARFQSSDERQSKQQIDFLQRRKTQQMSDNQNLQRILGAKSAEKDGFK